MYSFCRIIDAMKQMSEPNFVYEPLNKRHASKPSKKPRRVVKGHAKAIVTPDSPSELKPKKPRRRWKKILITVGLSVVGIVVVIGAYLFFHLAKITSNPFSL